MKIGEWAAARAAVAHMGQRAHKALRKANLAEAHLFRVLVVRAFNSGGKTNGIVWAKLRPGTRKRKKSSKPLIDTGDLRGSVTVIERGDEVFVGVPSNAKRSGGGPLVSIAGVHEFGKIIVQKRGSKMVLIKIPARSFLRSTASFHFKPSVVKERFMARVAIAMGHGWSKQPPAKARAMAQAGIAATKAGQAPKKVRAPKVSPRARDARGRFLKGGG